LEDRVVVRVVEGVREERDVSATGVDVTPELVP
jgi:hypothetical protein